MPQTSVYPSEERVPSGLWTPPPPNPPLGSTWPTADPQDGPHPTSPISPRMLVPKNVTVCSDGSRRRLIRSLEHVQVQLSLSYSRRGDLEIFLISPMGTRSTLVAIRCEKPQRALGASGALPSPPAGGTRVRRHEPSFSCAPHWPQTPGYQRPRLQQLELHVHSLLGRGPAGPVDPGPGEQGLLFQHR